MSIAEQPIQLSTGIKGTVKIALAKPAPKRTSLSVGVEFSKSKSGFCTQPDNGLVFPREVSVKKGQQLIEFDLRFERTPQGNMSQLVSIVVAGYGGVVATSLPVYLAASLKLDATAGSIPATYASTVVDRYAHCDENASFDIGRTYVERGECGAGAPARMGERATFYETYDCDFNPINHCIISPTNFNAPVYTSRTRWVDCWKLVRISANTKVYQKMKKAIVTWTRTNATVRKTANDCSDAF